MVLGPWSSVIEAYCDESGIQDGAPKCVVAGWVASARQWEQFEERWKRASGGVEFHGNRFFTRDDKGQRVDAYRGWTDEQAQDYLLGLVGVLQTSAIKSVGAVVDIADFEARTDAERKWLTGAAYLPEFKKWEGSGSPNRPYYLGFTHCIEGGTYCVKDPKWQVSWECPEFRV